MIKAIIMDVDGTLTNSKKQISEMTKLALLKAQKSGVKLVLASGRPVTGLIDFAKELEMDQHHGYLVAFNGSKVIDVQTNEVLFDETMSIEDGKEVLSHMMKFDVIPMIQKDDYMYVNDVYNCMLHLNGELFNIIKYESRGGKYKLCEIDDLAKFADFPLNKILVAGEPEYLQEHYIEMMEPFKDRLSCMFTARMYFEYTAKGIDKAKALDHVLKPLGINQDEMMAFGDGQNDASMVKYAGIGIAMANAVDELKEVADDITYSNEEDGIAKSIYKYMPELK